MVSPYLGDIEFSGILQELGVSLSLGEIKACLMGTIAAKNTTPMQITWAHIFSGREIEWENENQMNTFTKNLMGLWNELAQHQNSGNPFYFSPLKKMASPQDVQSALSQRTAEIKQFVKGLDAGGTDPKEYTKDGQESFRYLAEGDAMLEGLIDLCKRDKDPSDLTLKGLEKDLRKMDLVIHECVNHIILESCAIRRRMMESDRGREPYRGDAHKVGRNDPCPILII